jgi:hypothetical protein
VQVVLTDDTALQTRLRLRVIVLTLAARAVDTSGELYILSKSDGMIRKVVGVTARATRE